MGPAPVTSARWPGATAAAVMPWRATARGSVRAAVRRGRPSGTRTSSAAGQVTKAAKAPWKPPTPGDERARHSDGRPARHDTHSPQPTMAPPTTGSPTFQPATPGPRAAT